MIRRQRIFASGKLKTFSCRFILLAVLLSLPACALFRHKQEAKVQPPQSAGGKEQVSRQTAPTPPEPPFSTEGLPFQHSGKGRKPYQVKGKTYYPLLTSKGYEERGVACWYGPSFNGRRTSSGEIFDMYGISAAHKILPMETDVEVTNLENGKSIVLKINDRGPFVAGRVLDLSYGAAKSLAVLDKGLARVLIRTCGAVEGQQKNDIIGEFYVHVGAFEREADADCLLADMLEQRYKPWLLKVVKADRDGTILWRVELGPYKSMSLADKAHTKVITEYPSAFVVAK